MNRVSYRGTEYHHTHPSCLTDNLYLSAARGITSAVLLELGITSLINATLEMPSMAYQKQECIQIAVEDRICSKLYVYFDLVADKIHSVHLSGGKILVYCRAGMSRSATLCIAYFIKYHDMNVAEAFEFVKERRPIIHPNIGFMRQLREYETKLHHSKSSILRGPSSRRLLSFAKEEFCENDISSTLIELPIFTLGESDRAQMHVISDMCPAESYVITPLEILFLPPTSEQEIYRPPARARRTQTLPMETSKCIVSHFLQTSLFINHSMPDRVPSLCTCRQSLTDRTHIGIVVRKPEVADNLSEEFSDFAIPSSIISKVVPSIDLQFPLLSTIHNIYELNGLIIAHKNIHSRFSKSRASVKTKGLKLSSGLSPSSKAKKILEVDHTLMVSISYLTPMRLEQASFFSKEYIKGKESAIRVLTLNQALRVIQIGEFSGEELQDPPQSLSPIQREFPFYTLVTRRSILQTPLNTALVLPSVETFWFFNIQRKKRSSSKLNWAAERKHHGHEHSSEICHARPDIHYIHQTPRDLLPVPKLVAVTFATPDFVRHNPQILPRFLMQRYPSRTVANMCISPLLESLIVRKPFVFEYTNLYCEPRVSCLPTARLKTFEESRANRFLMRRIAINVTEVEVRKEFEDLMEIPSVKDASKFTSLIENVKKEGDLARLQIWFEVFKRFVLAGRPIHPFVAITELLPVATKSPKPSIFEAPESLPESFIADYAEPRVSTELDSILILRPTIQKLCQVLYCPGNAFGEDITEEGAPEEEAKDALTCTVEDVYASVSEEFFHGIASTLRPILYGEIADKSDESMDSSKYLQRRPFSILTGFKMVADQLTIQVGIDESDDEVPNGRIKKERPYIRMVTSTATENVESIAEPVDTFWYFQLDTPTAAVVKAEDEEKKRQKIALLQSKTVSDSRYQLFLPDPETVKRIEGEKKNVSFVDTRPVPTQRIGSLVSYQRPRSRSRARYGGETEDPNARALRDLDASFKESNLLLERRRKPDATLSPRSSAYYSTSESTSSSIGSLKGLLETAQKIIGGGSSATSSFANSSAGITSRPSRSSSKYRYYKSPR